MCNVLGCNFRERPKPMGGRVEKIYQRMIKIGAYNFFTITEEEAENNLINGRIK